MSPPSSRKASEPWDFRREGLWFSLFFFQAEDGIRDLTVTGVQTCALPIYVRHGDREPALFRDFTHHRVACRLAQVDQTAGQAPLAQGRRPPALDEQHAVAMEDDRADADPRVVRVLEIGRAHV